MICLGLSQGVLQIAQKPDYSILNDLDQDELLGKDSDDPETILKVRLAT